jgi:hypothetical protein
MKTREQICEKLDDSKGAIICFMRLQRVLFEYENLYFTLKECQRIWLNYSDDLCAGWLDFPSNDDSILPRIKSSDYFTAFEDYAKEK